MLCSSNPYLRSHLLIGLVGAAIFLLHSGAAAATEIKKPDCAALEKWAVEIDGDDRWLPLENYRGWVPRAFQDAAFEALFGAPALDWQPEDAKEMAAHVFACGTQAGEARRMDARKALYGARGYFLSNLRGILGRQETMAARAEREAEREAKQAERRKARAAEERTRAEARQKEREAIVAEALAAVLELPASPQLMHTLAVLREVNVKDSQEFERAQRQVGSEARMLMIRLRQQGSSLQDPDVAGKIEARYAALREELAGDYQSKVAALDNSTDSLRRLAEWEHEVGRQMAGHFGQDRTAELLHQMAAKRESIQAGIFARARQLIDAAQGNTQSDVAELEMIDRIVANSAKAGLTPTQLQQVRDYAAARQQVLAAGLLAAAREELDSYPETLDGLDKLRRHLYVAKRGPLTRADEVAYSDYMQAGRARLTEIAAEALPEFERSLAEFPESQEGLNMTEATLVSEQGFHQVREDVRADYLAALEARRAAISEVLEAKAAAQREAALAAGGDPDLVGYRFVDEQHLSQLEFRDEELVILNVMGMRTAGDYQISADDVIVRGPNGTMVLTRSGSGAATRLTGMGMTFQRAAP